MDGLNIEIKGKIFSRGASLVGFADLSEIPEDKRNNFKFAISIAVALAPDKVRAISEIPNHAYYNEYKKANTLLDEINVYTAALLKEKGFAAYSMTEKNVVVDQRVKCSILPHKTSATLSGLGWIGKCALLITEEYGAAVRFTTVLTDAPFETCTPVNVSKCGKCSECQKICPADAVSGKEWKTGIDRDAFFKALACRDKIEERGISFNYGRTHVTCGLCILACPWTKKYLERNP